MLTIKCAGCKKKLWKYNKIGHGEVLNCYKSRILKVYFMDIEDSKVICICGNEIGIDKGNYIKMIKKGFIYSGTKSDN